MKHSERFTNAVTKLYNAFHNGDLELEDCQKCAVGNICDNDRRWFSPIVSKKIGGNIFNPLIHNHNIKSNETMLKSGYSPEELANIEMMFARGHLGCKDRNISLDEFIDKFEWIRDRKEAQYFGLCAVVEYLCELEGIPNVMDYSKLFETENDRPKHKLEEVLA